MKLKHAVIANNVCFKSCDISICVQYRNQKPDQVVLSLYLCFFRYSLTLNGEPQIDVWSLEESTPVNSVLTSYLSLFC